MGSTSSSGPAATFLDFLELIGARHRWHLQPRLDVAVYGQTGQRGRLFGGRGPVPLYLLPAFLTYPHLGFRDKMRAVRGLLAMLYTRRDSTQLEDITFYDWLRARGQSEPVIANLWNVLIEGTLNDNVRDVSAAMGLMIVQDGMLGGGDAIRIGYPTVPLGEALARPARAYLENLGVRIMAGCPARRIIADDVGSAVQGVAVGESALLTADAYVSAVPFWTLGQLLPDALAAASPFPDLARLETSPIINVHLRYDRPVMAEDFCYFVGSPLQWVFNSSQITGQSAAAGEQSLTVSISAAWDYIGDDRPALARRIAGEFAKATPGARAATLLDAVVVKQRNATFRCVPGAGRYRPSARTAVPNLFLAGEWTATGWPSTMEGAVISGYNAAEAVMSSPRIRPDSFRPDS